MPDFPLLSLDFLLQLRHFGLTLSHGVLQRLVLLVYRPVLGLVGADLTLHVIDFTLQVPWFAASGSSHTCTRISYVFKTFSVKIKFD